MRPLGSECIDLLKCFGLQLWNVKVFNQSEDRMGSRDLTRPIRGQDKGLLTNDIRGWEWQECDKQTVMMTLVSIDLLSPDTGLHTPAHTSHCVPIVWCQSLIRSRTDLILNRISKLAPEFWDPIVPSLIWWYNPWYLDPLTLGWLGYFS